jgi:hypothetical protein
MSHLKGQKMDQLLTMSTREITRLEVMQRLKNKSLRQQEASCMLGLSIRQVKCLFRAFKDQGLPGLISRQRGKPIHPLILGSGRRLFPDGIAYTALQLMEVKPTPNGVVIAIYQPA